MDNDLLREAEAYCREANISPATLGVRALGNSRFFDRFRKKQKMAQDHAAKLRAYMADHPAPASDEAAA